MLSIGDFTTSDLFALKHHKKRFFPSVLAYPRFEQPRLKELVSRLNTALSPFFGDDSKQTEAEKRCFRGWETTADSFLPGCPSVGGCRRFSDVSSAKLECEQLGKHCGGLIETRGHKFELRAGNSPQPSAGGEQAYVKIPCTKPTTAINVYAAFHGAIDAALQDQSLHLDSHDQMMDGLAFANAGEKKSDPAPPKNFAKQQDTVFLSVASYRDENCGATVASAFAMAAAPDLLTVGVVEQNCHGDCLIGTGWGKTRRIVAAPPDVDCLTEYCASAVGAPICKSGRVKLLKLNESESYGPLFARYIASKQWSGQEFFSQVDSHTDFKQDWDQSMIRQLKATPSFPKSVISNYPPGHGTEWPAEGSTSPPMSLCNIVFSSRIMRLGETPRTYEQTPGEAPRHSLYIAAGFLFTHASFLQEVRLIVLVHHTQSFSYTRALIHSYIIHSYTHTSYTHTIIPSYTHTLIHSYTHTLIHSYTHTLHTRRYHLIRICRTSSWERRSS
jgi:hypothetical protein